MANTLEIPSLTDVPIIRNPAPGIDVSASLGPKNPSDILRDPRFFKLPPAEQTAIKRMVMAKVTGAGGALAPGTYPRTITPGMVTRKPIMPEVARKAKMSDQAQNILTLTQ